MHVSQPQSHNYTILSALKDRDQSFHSVKTAKFKLDSLELAFCNTLKTYNTSRVTTINIISSNNFMWSHDMLGGGANAFSGGM